MLRLAYSREASADIDEIAAFSVDHFGPAVAENYLNGIQSACERLCEFPKMAAIYPRLRPVTRCLIYRSHRIFYRIIRDTVIVARILHQRRDVIGAMKR